MSIDDIQKLQSQIDILLKKNQDLEHKLQSYTNPKRNKIYYSNNSDIVKAKAKLYMNKIKDTDPDKLKLWRHNAYLKRKAKLLEQKQSKSNN